jgi:hypothetical protein
MARASTSHTTEIKNGEPLHSDVGEVHHPTSQAHHERLAFWRHYAEMVVAMAIGMALFGVPFRAILRAGGYDWTRAVAQLTAVVCIVMTFNMAVAMVAWMRLRGHSWRASAEMTAAMYVATGLALCLFWIHLVSADGTLALMHALMLPAMLALMLYRRGQYSAHGSH